MHIPDGIIDLWLCAVLYGVAILYGGFALKKARKQLDESLLSRLAIFTALVFAFQMLNFPIAYGTSGHFLGFVLLAILMGPGEAFLSIMVVLIIQALVFADGGILALGANIVNMGIVAAIGYGIFRLVTKKQQTKRSIMLGSMLGAWASVVTASLAAAIEIGVSESYPFGMELTIPSMVSWHMIIGIGEALITAGVVTWILRAHPEFIIKDLAKVQAREMVQKVEA
jgi:cobalt/nickel transport system permease protein